jgi:hypothetical protein
LLFAYRCRHLSNAHREKAEELLNREMSSLLQHDAAKYPVLPVTSALGGKEAKEARKVRSTGRGVYYQGRKAGQERGKQVR